MSPNRSVLALLLLSLCPALACSAAPPRARAAFEPLGNAEAWDLLPREQPPLPAWARVLARTHPSATAHLLALDHLHRAKNPLPPALRAQMRWIAADVNRCDYSKRTAEFDLKRAGDQSKPAETLLGDFSRSSEKERMAFAFARKVSKAAHTVTDQEVADLIRAYGEESVVAMVHTLAHANFQDRLFLALGVRVETGGPLAPLDVRIREDAPGRAPARPPWKAVLEAKVSFDEVKPGWQERDIAEVRKSLDAQKGRKARIALPPAKRLDALPEAAREQAKKIVWTNVSMGYQPELTRSWFAAMGAASREGPLDPIFSNSLFWVITRSSDCFY